MFDWLKLKPRAAARAGAPAAASVDGRAPAVSRALKQSNPLLKTDPDLLLRRLEWTVIRRLDGMLQGDYRTLFRGAGFDLADLREYLPHDDVRHIDWNVTARLQIPHVREHQEDREVAAWLILDLSGSIDFGSSTISKRMLALEFSAVIAKLLTRRGNRVGALLHTGDGEPDILIQPRSGRRHVLHLMRAITHASPGARRGDTTELGAVLANALASVRRRAAVFVVSDFISLPGWEQALSLLARRHDTVAVRLFDPLELELPDLGMLALRDAETDELLWIDSSDRGLRERFERAAEEREDALRQSLARSGVDCLELATDEALDASLLRFTRLRKRRAQLSAGAAPSGGAAA